MNRLASSPAEPGGGVLAVVRLLLAVVAGVSAGIVASCTIAPGKMEVDGESCFVCHEADYLGATSPAHHGLYPTECGDCHTTDGWAPALMGSHPEEDFPITEGPHAGISCADCHDPDRGSYEDGANSDCVGCHDGSHARDLMDSFHDGHSVSGYDPAPDEAPNFCLSCHPAGLADGVGHPESDFPIETGAHAGLECASCHDSDRGLPANGSNTDCVGCHDGSHARDLMDGMHEAIAAPGYDPAPDEAPNFCLSCHPSGRADGAGHPESQFPITTGAHAGLGCTSCHDPALGLPTDGANTDCIGCHLAAHPRSVTDDTHASRAGYPRGPASPNFCLRCHPDGSASSAGHPESTFPVSSGPHSVFECADCHNASLSDIPSENLDCVGCHTGDHSSSQTDPRHNEGDVWADYRDAQSTEGPDFCLVCHPRGVAED